METGPDHNAATPAGGESGGRHTVRLRGGQSRARHPAKPMRIKAKLPTSHAEMASIGHLALCCRTTGSYVESAGENSSHSLTWNKRIVSMAGDCTEGLASSLPPISDFCPRPALPAASARGATVPGAGRRAPPRGSSRRLTVTPGREHVSGRTDRDNELMTPGTMLSDRSVVERCHGLASGHGSREPTRDQPREACRGR